LARFNWPCSPRLRLTVIGAVLTYAGSHICADLLMDIAAFLQVGGRDALPSRGDGAAEYSGLAREGRRHGGQEPAAGAACWSGVMGSLTCTLRQH